MSIIKMKRDQGTRNNKIIKVGMERQGMMVKGLSWVCLGAGHGHDSSAIPVQSTSQNSTLAMEYCSIYNPQNEH